MTSINTLIAQYFKNQKGIGAIYLFGSHAANAQRPFGDVDIGIIVEHAAANEIKKSFNTYRVELGRILRKDIHPVLLNLASERLLTTDNGQQFLLNIVNPACPVKPVLFLVSQG
jgi:predicted nucleotidyltransferase